MLSAPISIGVKISAGGDVSLNCHTLLLSTTFDIVLLEWGPTLVACRNEQAVAFTTSITSTSTKY